MFYLPPLKTRKTTHPLLPLSLDINVVLPPINAPARRCANVIKTSMVPNDFGTNRKHFKHHDFSPIPYHPCVVYLPTFTIKNNQMWENISYMDGMGIIITRQNLGPRD